MLPAVILSAVVLIFIFYAKIGLALPYASAVILGFLGAVLAMAGFLYFVHRWKISERGDAENYRCIFPPNNVNFAVK